MNPKAPKNPKTYRYFIKLAYNGKNYHGWQRQDNAGSVQEVVEDALSKIFGDKITLTGAGRTDAGVHAREFFAHFDFHTSYWKRELQRKTHKLNGFLPKDIKVFEIFKVRDDMHARFDAESRTYEYIITTAKDPFIEDFAWYVYGEMDVDRMNEGASILLEYNDFTSFSKLHSQVRTNNCEIMSAVWEKRNDLLVFTITADRFLRNMVRAIVGTLVDVGKGKITLEDFRNIIEARNRSEAGLSVPAQGLYLTAIQYPDELTS